MCIEDAVATHIPLVIVIRGQGAASSSMPYQYFYIATEQLQWRQLYNIWLYAYTRDAPATAG